MCPAVLEEIFEGFRVNPKCLPDQLTYDVIVIQPYSKWQIDHLFAVVTSSLKQFWTTRFFFPFFKLKKQKQYGFQTT